LITAGIVKYITISSGKNKVYRKIYPIIFMKKKEIILKSRK